jgi:hypothetical protein
VAKLSQKRGFTDRTTEAVFFGSVSAFRRRNNRVSDKNPHNEGTSEISYAGVERLVAPDLEHNLR